MGDFVFKNIPTEGFDPEAGFIDRVSNPTPSRKSYTSEVTQFDEQSDVPVNRLSNPSVRSAAHNMNLPDDTPRISNSFPTKRVTVQEDEVLVLPEEASYDSSRASNPTPTRRGYTPVSPFYRDVPVVKSPIPVLSDDPYSRASNPTPTRRRSSKSTFADNEKATADTLIGTENDRVSNPTPRRRDNSSLNFSEPTTMNNAASVSLNDESLLRASNPTPTRRNGMSVQPVPTEKYEKDAEPVLSFSGLSNLDRSGVIGLERESNPTPTRRIFSMEAPPSDDEDDNNENDNRFSNYTPTHRR